MSDDLKPDGAPYAHRIDMLDEDQIEYWTNRLDVTTEALAQAVEHVGADAERVAVYLGKPT